MGSLRRTERLSVLLVCAWAVSALVGWGGSRAAEWASDVSLSVLALLAAGCLARAARRRPAGRRLPLALLSLACGLWGVGEVLWTWYELVLGQEVPFPSVADLAYLAGAPVAGSGLLTLTRGLRQRTRRARAALDGWLVAGSLLAAGWVLLLDPVARSAEGGPLAVGVAVAYPAMDVVITTVAVLVLLRGAAGRRRSIALVVAALLSMAAADSAFTGLELLGRYRSGGLVDLGWVASYLLFALAARTDDVADEDPGVEALVGKTAALLPYLFVAGAIAVLGVATLLTGRTSRVAIVLLVSLVLALLVRQALTVLDNVALAELLALRERHYRSLVHGATDVIVLCGRDLHATYVSPSSVGVLGIVPEQLVGRPLWDFVHPDDVGAVRVELARVLDGRQPDAASALLRCRIASSDGWIDTESSIGDLRGDPSVAGIVITTRDISERTALENQLRALAWKDPLTGLANRSMLRERLEHALGQRRPDHSPLGLLLVDLDGFKAVNDTYGHAAGDALLVQVAERLTRGVRQGDTVARLGGDEFAVLLEVWGEGEHTHSGPQVAERLLVALKQPFVVDGAQVSIGASMGLVLTAQGAAAEDLMRQADFAMYASKEGGRGRVTLFGAELAAESTRRAELAVSLAAALTDGGLHLDYQPIVDLATGRVTGAEALARWSHPTWGAISPAEFIPVAESTGLIVELGHWALLSAARQAAVWEAEGLSLDVAVNVSVRQLGSDFVDAVAAVLVETALTPARLTLEITESVLVDGEKTLVSLNALRDLGVRLAVDDFGTGWSSLAYLRRLPVHILKLDGSFVAGLGTSEADAVSRTIVQLATDLGLEVVAEGVETSEQRDVLVTMGCHSAQGWLLGRPGPAEQVVRVRAHDIPRQRVTLKPTGSRTSM